MKGKEKCRVLKDIRTKIAEENEIEFHPSECTHTGECKGTCPKCEAEMRYIEKEIEKKSNAGKKVAVVGLATGMMASLTACTPLDVVEFVTSVVGISGSKGGDIQGDIAMPIPTPAPDMFEGGMVKYDPEYDILGDIDVDPDYELEGDVACPIDDCEQETENVDVEG